MLTLAASIQDSFGNRGHDNQRSKIIQIGKKKKKKNKNCHCMQITWYYTQIIHKYAARKLAELVSEIVKFARCQFNTQKYITFLYTKNERTEREIKETIPFIIVYRRVTHLGMNFTKMVKDLYSENCNTLMKKN